MGSDHEAPRRPPALFAIDGFTRVSRRDFIRLNLAFLAMAGTGSCRWFAIPSDERRSFRLIRAEDLLSLTVTLGNLRIEHRWHKPPRLVRIREGEEAFLGIGFPGQHILEQAYPENGGNRPIKLPAQGRLARPSRLVFKLPPERRHIDLTFDALLDWRDWISIWPETGANGRILGPADMGSLVQLPYGLALTPEGTTRWRHARQPVTHDGRTELWHTRLTTPTPQQAFAVQIIQPHPSTGEPGHLTTSLTARDRHDLAGQTAQAHTLILSAMGGWLDVRGAWESGPIARWQHKATAGQDQKVVVQRKDGFLYPFGQRAALIKVTERKLDLVGRQRTPQALLRQRHFVVIKKPSVDYAHAVMALKSMTALDLVTPPLDNAREDGVPFWIETGPGDPFRFRFRAHDWAERQLFLEAPAIFVSDPQQLATAKEQYEDEDRADWRIILLRGQAAAVARFDSGVEGDKDRWGEALEQPRSVGDTTLHLLQIEFAGDERTRLVAGGPPFACRTRRLEVRLPSLEPYLNDDVNRGWFALVDPDPPENLGEIFVRASGAKKIPMYFDQQADRSGGLAAPSFDVDGISRVRGPVGDARPEGPMYEGGRFEPEKYFNAERAKLLGSLPLAELLLTDSGTKSPAVPAINFSLARKQPEKDSESQEKPPAHWEVGLGLAWRVLLEKPKSGSSAINFVPDLDEKGKSKARLAIDARLTKTLGKPAPNEDQTDEGQAAGAAGEDARTRKPPPAVTWSVSGNISKFALRLDAEPLGELSIGFVRLGVTLGPAPPEKKKDASRKEDRGEKKAKKSKLAAAIDYEMGAITATGVLSFLLKLIQKAADLPYIPNLDRIGGPSVSQPTLPGVEDADVSLTVGPVDLPTPAWKWLEKFEVANLAVSMGVGLYFLPRQPDESKPARVPDNLFTIRVASPDKPLTLIAAPWGGLAHVGFNFTPRGMTGFMAGLGIVYRAEFDLGGAKAKCEGSLTGVFTYEMKQDGTASHQVALVLKLTGQAVVAGFIEIYLNIVAAGFWEIEANRWTFAAEITVRIKISFFAVSARFSFSYELAGSGGEDRLLTGRAASGAASRMPTDPAPERLSESEWLAYRAAFAMEAP